MIEPFRDPAQPLAARVEDLLGRLTLREKVASSISGCSAGTPMPAHPVAS
jgi:hypothetical protein